MNTEAQVILGFTQGEDPISLLRPQMDLIKKYGKTWEVVKEDDDLVIIVTFFDGSNIKILVG